MLSFKDFREVEALGLLSNRGVTLGLLSGKNGKDRLWNTGKYKLKTRNS